MQSNNARDGIFFKSALDDGQLGSNENRVAYFVPYDIVDKSADERKLFALNNGLPAGTTFDCSLNAMTSFCGEIEVDAQGNMSVAANNNSFFTSSPFPSFNPRQLKTNVNASGKTIDRENKLIKYLSGFSHYIIFMCCSF